MKGCDTVKDKIQGSIANFRESISTQSKNYLAFTKENRYFSSLLHLILAGVTILSLVFWGSSLEGNSKAKMLAGENTSIREKLEHEKSSGITLKNELTTAKESLESLASELAEAKLTFKSLTDDYNDLSEKNESLLNEIKLLEDELAQLMPEEEPSPVPSIAPAPEPTPAPTIAPTTGGDVWIPNSGTKYHSNSSCSNMRNPSQVSLATAQSMGYTQCSKCW